jgi:hypothetical protein
MAESMPRATAAGTAMMKMEARKLLREQTQVIFLNCEVHFLEQLQYTVIVIIGVK